jgi:hypothetical protein
MKVLDRRLTALEVACDGGDRCPECGRGLNPDEAPVIRLGGHG